MGKVTITEDELETMKIAILSMQKVINFGSVLQAYSLKEMIREITGNEPAFIDLDYSDCVPRVTPKPNDNKVEAYRANGIIAGIKRKIFRKLRKNNDQKIVAFMNEELHIDEKMNNDAYDYVVVGSDEVFNNTHNDKGLSLQLYGNVKQAKEVFTYAAAAGAARYEDIPASEIDKVKKAMSNFTSVSVRDDQTYEYVAKLYDGPIEHHLDPVLVGPLSGRAHKAVNLKNYMIVYSYNERMRNADEINSIKKFAKEHGLKTVSIGGVQFWCDLYLSLTPFEALDYFYHADYVVTDTFHGTVFSIINKATFAVFIRPSNEAKMRGLLSDLKLEDRILSSSQELAEVLSKPIDYSTTYEILEDEKKRSREYLGRKLS